MASAKCPCKNSRNSIGNAGRGFPLSEAGLGLDVAAGCCEEISCGEPAIGSRALVVDPYDDASRSFYQHFGFREIPGSGSLFVRLRS